MKRLVKEVQDGINQKESMELIYNSHRGLIHEAVNCYRDLADPDDLAQEGYLGLVEAVMHYDDTRGASFSTYARAQIRWAMLRYIETSGAIRVPAHIRQQIRDYNREKERLTHALSREPTDEELRGVMGLTLSQYRNMIKCMSAGLLVSLDEPREASGDGETSLYDIIATAQEDMQEAVADSAAAACLKRELWRAVDELPENQTAVIRARYGEGRKWRDVTEEFSSVLGLTRDQVRQLERNALKALRRPRYRKMYGPYMPDWYQAKVYRGSGVQQFKETWTSSVEKTAIRMYEPEAF